MKKIFTLCFAVASLILFRSAELYAQGVCFEIESILVDACGTPEGENEMVRFNIGPAPLNVANLSVNWPNNNWNGLCQNAATAAIVSNINQNMLGCGSVTEPVGGVLPANSKVLLVTSTNINITSNSFINLNDDLIILFQCPGNTSGHFANYNVSPGLRTLVIQFSGAGGCSDTVTYDRTLLVNQFGTVGGTSFDNDGSYVSFTASGVPAYLNSGCQVLSSGLSLTGGPDVGLCPGGATTATLNGSAINLIGNVQWAGGTGTFSQPNSLNTIYTPGPGETGLVILTVTGNGPCNATKTDTVRVNIVPFLPSSITLTQDVFGTITSSFTDPGFFYNWYPVGSSSFIFGAFSPTFTPTANGCYYMILSTIGNCFVQSDTSCITNVGLAADPQDFTAVMLNNPGANPVLMIQSPISANVIIETLDIYGKVISGRRININAGRTEVPTDWSNMASGIYILRAVINGRVIDKKTVLIK